MINDIDDPPSDASIVEPIRILQCPAAEFYGVNAGAVKFLKRSGPGAANESAFAAGANAAPRA
jgi:hypothetical protein